MAGIGSQIAPGSARLNAAFEMCQKQGTTLKKRGKGRI
jgi:hypothetical protein